MRVLFITWDAPTSAYLESLFLPIFVGLREHDVRVDVLQFRWGRRSETERVAETCRLAGIGYRHATIMRKLGGSSAMVSALLGRRALLQALRYFESDILMPRSLMPALVTLTARADKLKPVLFDADGLAADERVEFGGLSPLGTTYRLLRDVESQMVLRSRAVIVRSSRAGDILADRAGPPVERNRFFVVTNGRDENLFVPGDRATRTAMRAQLGLAPSAPVVAYAGSFGRQYRFDRLATFFSRVLALRSDARLLVLTGSPAEARAALAEHGAAVADAMLVQAVPPAAVPAFLACADIGTAFRQPSFSMAAVAPIKLAEYLLCGLPVIGTGTVGDTRAARDAGVFFDEEEGLDAAAQWFVAHVLPRREQMRGVAREIGVAEFSLARAVSDYLRAIDGGLARETRL